MVYNMGKQGEVELRDEDPQVENKTITQLIREDVINGHGVEFGLVEVDDEGDYLFSHLSFLYKIADLVRLLEHTKLKVKNARLEVNLFEYTKEGDYGFSVFSKLLSFSDLLNGRENIEDDEL